jgi:hypothetical protein
MKKYIFFLITTFITLSADAQHSLFEHVEELDALLNTKKGDSRTLIIHHGGLWAQRSWELQYLFHDDSDDKLERLKPIFIEEMEKGDKSYHNEKHQGGTDDQTTFKIHSTYNIDEEHPYAVMGFPVEGECNAIGTLNSQMWTYPHRDISVSAQFYQRTPITENDKKLNREIDKALYKILKKGKTTTHRFAYDDPHDHSQKEFQSLSNLPKHTEGVIYDYTPKDHKLFSQFVSTIYSYLYAGESFYLMHNKSYSDTLTAWTSVDCTDNPYIKESARGETFTSHDGKKIMNVKSPKGGETITFALGHHNEPGYIIWSIYYGDGDFRVLRAEGKQGACVPNNWKIYDSIDPEIQKLFIDKKRKK